jgi:hypothetical protein
LIVLVSNPSVPRSIKNPLIPSSVFAQTIAKSAIEASEIHCFRPLSTQPAWTFLALVSIEAGSEPALGSVSPKQPIASPLARAGSQRRFWASEPKRQMGYMTSAEMTAIKLLRLESSLSASWHTTP